MDSYNCRNLSESEVFDKLRGVSENWQDMEMIYDFLCEYAGENDFDEGILHFKNEQTIFQYLKNEFDLSDSIIEEAILNLKRIFLLEESENRNFKITNWRETQEIEKRDLRREQDRLRQQKCRKKEKEVVSEI